MSDKLSLVRERCEADFVSYITIVAPYLCLGNIHHEVAQWMTRIEANDNLMILLPRAHLKSRLAALLTSWLLTRNPIETIMYASATSTLAEAQLFQIKQILESKIYRRYWPEMINAEEAKRERWTTSEIAIDHPLRAAEGIRDMSVKAVGITSNTTGLHASIVILDDVVVPNNAYTEDGRDKVEKFYSQLASIENPNAKEFVFGTRYHPRDLYSSLMAMQETTFNEEAQEYEDNNVFEIFTRVVEEHGEFLWPRASRNDGKMFGFDEQVLARIKAKYLDTTQFFAQYYQEPNHSSNAAIDGTKFQYYDKAFLTQTGGHWHFKGKKLNVYAAIDFAFSSKTKADSSALVVVGVDSDYNYYILDIRRFKTDKIKVYFENIFDSFIVWNFRKIRAEVTVAQQAIVTELKESYIKKQGLSLSVDEFRPNRNDGDKADRIEAILSPKYDNLQMWHYKSGLTNILEEELVAKRPPHDDLKDALANAVAIAKAPMQRIVEEEDTNVIRFHSRFGGLI